MNICIVGGGNIGTYLAAYISRKTNVKVWLYTSKPALFANEIELEEQELEKKTKVKIHCITNQLKEAIQDANIILITYPSFMVGELLKEISEFVKEGTYIGVIPGFGGAEFYKEDFLAKGCKFIGTQRVPAIVRLNEYGKSVCLKETNPFMKICAFPKEATKEICEKIEDLIDIKCEKLHNYLPITLSPSNPTMHPSRLYELFRDYNKEITIYEENPLFYEQWGDKASTYLLELDEEIHLIFNVIGIVDNYEVEKIKERFNIEQPWELTDKIRNASGFKGIHSPMNKVEGGYIPDLESRYFVEDIPFGMCIIKAFAQICGVETPRLDEIIIWAQGLLGKEYLVEGRLSGKDAHELLIPQNINILTVEDIIKYYS